MCVRTGVPYGQMLLWDPELTVVATQLWPAFELQSSQSHITAQPASA